MWMRKRVISVTNENRVHIIHLAWAKPTFVDAVSRDDHVSLPTSLVNIHTYVGWRVLAHEHFD